ncbi:hypothetical protein G2W53_017412 [Senna tora]|uniref:Uncharacterized protein n=1 Tax=Senna tora TaxID=362788 RepID=A0A834WMF0_9FABA|nr:hypothetical protein G2W53_017412 [Senna tora]
MGNACFGGRMRSDDDVRVRRLKVRMTRRQLRELMAKATAEKGVADYNSELGRLVFQEYSSTPKPTFPPPIHLLPTHTPRPSSRCPFTLTPIQEHSHLWPGQKWQVGK